MQRNSWKLLQTAVKVLADILAPIIPAIIAAGLLKGLANILANYNTASFGQLTAMVGTFSDTAYAFLPIVIGWSAAKRFGANQILGILLGALLVHPDLLNGLAYSQAVIDGKVPYWQIFGFSVPKVGYQGTVLPIMVAVYVMSLIERLLKKVIPSFIELLVVPLLTVVISGMLAFTVIGPIAREVGIGIANAFLWVLLHAPLVGALLYGALFTPLVITGMHHVFLAVNIQLLAQTGATFLWPIEALCSVAQASAAAAMFFAVRETKLKQIATAAAVSAYFGVTEPALFGINLRFVYPFGCALIGSAAAAAYITLHQVQALGVGVGGLPALISMQPEKMVAYFGGMMIAVVVPFGLTIIVSRYAGYAEGKAN
ncbi:MAG: PTS transporter subunit EIIC [Bacillota bacterium]